MTTWQMAAGSEGRDYSEYFLKYGIAFVGDGSHMEQVNLNDMIVLKEGISAIKAVGTVVERDGHYRGQGNKEWLKDFDGWRLQAYCYVDWRIPGQGHPIQISGLTRGTIKRVWKQEVRDKADEIFKAGRKVEVYPEPEPEPVKVEDDNILECLIKEGLRPTAADELTSAISKIRLLAAYYYDNVEWKEVGEHETRTFLVVPLLLALGWAEQQIKIELNNADLVLFKGPYRGKSKMDDCVAIIETKGFALGLDYAQGQAENYAKHFPSCEALITTNGYCYRIYKKEDAGFKLSAYINLLEPKDKYPLNPDVKGALEAIKYLLPNHYLASDTA